MDWEANLPAPPAPPPSSSTKNSLVRPINNPDFNLSRSFTSTTSSSSSSSSPGFARNVQAAFKRHRPLGTTHLNNIRPRRMLVPQRETSKDSSRNLGSMEFSRKNQDEILESRGLAVAECGGNIVNTVLVVDQNHIDASITPPFMSGTITNTYEESIKPFDFQRDQPRFSADHKTNDVKSQHLPMVDTQKKVKFSLTTNAGSQEMDQHASNQPEAMAAISHELDHQNSHNIEADISLRSDGAKFSLFTKKMMELQDHQCRNSLPGDMSHPMTQSSVVGSSCTTTTFVNSASAPLVNSMTHGSQLLQSRQSNVPVESIGDCNVSSQLVSLGNLVQQPSIPSSKCSSKISADRTAAEALMEIKEYDLAREPQDSGPVKGNFQKDPSRIDEKSNKGKALTSDVSDLQCQPSLSKNQSSDVKPSKSDKQEKSESGKTAPRKRNYDPDLFFKVNGKLYQRLGKIGTGGSSEVHKVISSDCKIYALKKIKLKGRDYATAYGFCQEILYLNKLKGKNNIIQLIDYEVTDKTLLQEVMNGSMSNKDGRVKEDGCIYMLLEYGEIDLAHMLSQKWKEMDSTNSTINENWLRFYWQQILLAVNTIHEERIVHSDLKPANFLLVRGSLKLIDFGIAKAIMSDTTNIQRDSQVGTLSYMSPEAFMCNETDANGKIIKCGRPSDIWSLGCILYQMVYGRTPFSEYKTFWAKFKVITDPNHEITYEPLANPWLIDLMKKCLAWERNERWRIPQLLQHPFLVPPIQPQLPCFSRDKSLQLLQLIAESCANNQRALSLCDQLQELLENPRPETVSQVSISQDETM
ncbi:serine/threonine-protein kinase MPS1 isoform X2 [Diospyros lotus]|uniref:serine/threonine-protein kinase MPS1 isoform X2 n=1 Tax=Diospyros lotus TaxID=55363 RepID=UPI0022570160|nr:serine/threonine-protein kinase MPS1 isoform X2 [Diospyros lotus]